MLDDPKFQKFMASYRSCVEFSEKWWAKIRKNNPQ
jgi:hypothetical protein